MSDYGYGLWLLVVIDSAVLIGFAISFVHPSSGRDWKAMGAFGAFVVALFTEMYGVPLTIYLLSGLFGDRIGLSHTNGHLWNDLIGWKGDPHLSPFHLASYAFIGGGFWLMSAAWPHLWRAVRADVLATDGPYARIRHPQYTGFMLIMVGFLLQWPTLITLIMFPILVIVYRRLAFAEEAEVRAKFGATWDAYAASHPRFIPHRRRAGADRHGAPNVAPSLHARFDASWDSSAAKYPRHIPRRPTRRHDPPTVGVDDESSALN